ncbi:MAG: HisA/HisF-related TIM barrel protein, partial [Myxococcota bacterium]
MIIYPAIDLIAGQAVRLAQGRFADKTVYPTSPVELAERYRAAGASHLHVVDLDGAKRGQPAQGPLVAEIAGA